MTGVIILTALSLKLVLLLMHFSLGLIWKKTHQNQIKIQFFHVIHNWIVPPPTLTPLWKNSHQNLTKNKIFPLPTKWCKVTHFGHIDLFYLENGKRYRKSFENHWKLSMKWVKWNNPIKIWWKIKFPYTPQKMQIHVTLFGQFDPCYLKNGRRLRKD